MKILFPVLVMACLASSVFGQKSVKEISPEHQETKVQDIDGNIYNTIKIGNQTWMAENLKTTRYLDGSSIPLVVDDVAWSALTSGGYCWFYNDPATYKNTYGAIYNWYTVTDSRKLCPQGWHVPSDGEWNILISCLGGPGEAGGKMKESNTLHWISPNIGATNESGFIALPGGDRHDNGPFYDVGYYCYWWSATEKEATKAWMYCIIKTSPEIERSYFTKNDGFYVRCIKE